MAHVSSREIFLLFSDKISSPPHSLDRALTCTRGSDLYTASADRSMAFIDMATGSVAHKIPKAHLYERPLSLVPCLLLLPLVLPLTTLDIRVE